MKKFVSFAFLLGLLTSFAFLPSCGKEDKDTSSEEETASSAESSEQAESSAEESAEPVPDENTSFIWNELYADADAGLASAQDIYNAKYYYNGGQNDNYSQDPAEGDAKFIFCGKEAARFVNVADGYMITIPVSEVTGDFSLSENRSKLFADDAVITISKEDQNPYPNTADGWDIYFTEWLTARIGDLNFLSANNIMRTTQSKTYTDLIEGYEVTEYDMYIKLPKEIERPYYNIAIIRKNGDYKNCYLVVMKSAAKVNDKFNAMIGSMAFIDSVGESANHVGQYDLIIPEYWSDETKAYYNKLMNNDVPDWGFFYAGNDQAYIDWLQGEEGIDYQPEIFMTYLHIGWYNDLSYLDLDFVTKNAGGNGFDGKPVLNLTYQFTTTNNSIAGFSPMFDILRGNYDDHFRKLAQDIKAYGKPVIFRLNNEMNTDWTSYCGMVTLLDPDIFIMTWQRLYNIFIEEGVDNTIWVFNPIKITCPYCDWGAYLTYFPGVEYVQMLGLTDYETGNGNLTSFKTMYTEVYEQYITQFDNYPWMIGEFACGAGGAKQYDWGSSSYKDTVLGRTEAGQAAWLEQMFICFSKSNEEGYEFANEIKAAVWFSANDYANVGGKDYITNYYNIDDKLDLTIAKFKEWLPKIHEND
ncbi:MAG: hypothetical protein PHW77_03150 [Eubacteriales bacterium]|nr:hypothetical protein [Eubacteriales bacterium]